MLLLIGSVHLLINLFIIFIVMKVFLFLIDWIRPRSRGPLFLPGELESQGHKFTPDKEQAEVYLSVVVPAYNEEERLHLGLDDCLSVLLHEEKSRRRQQPPFTWEIIVVNDGSTDETATVTQSYIKRYGPDRVRLLDLTRNRLKGGAVQRGVLCARGQYILMMDADGATQFADFRRLEQEMLSLEEARVPAATTQRPPGHVVVGSRKHLQEQAIAERSLFRTVLMVGFHFLVATIGGVTTVQDTQCGFKLFSRAAGRRLFRSLHVDRWAFDVELLYLATRFFHMPVAEVPVHWQEVDGSKINIISAIPQMLMDLFLMRLAYVSGFWVPAG